MKFEEGKRLVEKCATMWKDHLIEFPKDGWMEDCVISYPGEEIPLFIPVCSIDDKDGFIVGKRFGDLKKFGTICGDRGCYTVFNNPGVVEFLQGFCIEFVVVSVNEEILEEDAWDGAIPIYMMAFKGSAHIAPGFANMINHLGGSLRWDDSDGERCLFESE